MLNPPCASRGGNGNGPSHHRHQSTTTPQHHQTPTKMYYDHNSHRCCRPQAAPETFTKFQRLPAEIRTMIWEYSLPESRVYEVLDAPNANQKTPARKGLMFANVHPEPPPALAAVCRESRYFVLHHYKPLTLGQTTKYVDLSRDILLLEPYLLVKRLHRTLHFMSQIPLLRDNINRLALGTSYGIYTGICHPVLSWRVSKTNMSKLLSSLAKFPRLKMLIFIVHQEFQFEFDFRFPGTMTPIPKDGSPYAVSTLAPAFSSLGNPNGRGAPPSGGGNRLPPSSQSQSPPTPTTVTIPSAARNNISLPSGYLTPSSSPPSTLPTPPQSTQLSSPLLPRPQQVHQAYRFKFDIEANINESPHGRPHLNELLYYPLNIDEDNDDDVWDMNDGLDGDDPNSEWCDPWPTNDDWRRFRKRFQRAINLSVESGSEDGEGKGKTATATGQCPVRELHSRYGSGSGKGGNGMAWRDGGARGDGDRDGRGGGGGGKKFNVPALKGASLLWRYTRGGYV